jgi:molybdenum cofactor biosynthesis enzyme MoaA
MPKCLALKHAATIGPLGTVRPCCAWNNNLGKETPLGVEFYHKHELWYQQLLNNWLPECRECQQSEEAGNSSLRNYFNDVLAASNGVEYWDFKINNTCNLACRMCDPVNSSTWNKIQQAIDPGFKSNNINKWHKRINEMLPELYTAKVIKFTGGEPFLIPQVKKIIEFLVAEEIASAVTLHFITNGTQDLAPYYGLLSSFNRVIISVSVDAIDERFEYIRAGASWKQVSENIININNNKHTNTELSINCLPQALNIGYIDDVEQWCIINNLNFHLSSPVIAPDYMRPEALTQPDLRKKLIYQMQILDKIHNTDYRDFI